MKKSLLKKSIDFLPVILPMFAVFCVVLAGLSNCGDGNVIVTIKYTADAVTKGVNAQWGVGNMCDIAWTNLDGFGFNAGGDAVEGDTFTLTYTVAQLKAANVSVVNAWNGCVAAGVVYVPAAGGAGDVTPVAAVAVMALVSCAAVVVLRKKEA